MIDSYGPEGDFLAKQSKSFHSQGMEIVVQRKTEGWDMFSGDIGSLDVAQDETKIAKKLLCRCSKNAVRLMGQDVGNVACKCS